MSEWMYGVTYESGHGKIKDKHFQTEDEAKKFYDKLGKFKCSAALFRFRKSNLIDRILDAKITWMGFEINLLFAALGLVIGYFVMETIWYKIP